MEQQQQHRTAWERQLLIRDKNRPTVRDYIPRIFTDFYEMHGDRNFGDDGAIIGGIGRLNGLPVTILAQVKGRNLRENKASNFAMQVSCSPPESSFSAVPYRRIAPQPPGPGLPLHAPSVKICTVFICCLLVFSA